ncbi:MAG: KH domain-containing protein, partial [Deltaproteobacteria bacterium]|nr:KH domain-containing protein [Deltaproteobacteria bacterium]
LGMKGARVQAVVQELRGEKIDIVPFSTDMARYVCSAIAPAEVQRVLIDENKRQIEVIVADDQLSLAIGKKGQNVKLATKLLDWRIEIHSESKVKETKDELRKLSEIEGVDDSLVEYLFKLGFHSADNIANADITDLTNIPGISEEIAAAIQNFAREIKKKGSAQQAGKEQEVKEKETEKKEETDSLNETEEMA